MRIPLAILETCAWPFAGTARPRPRRGAVESNARLAALEGIVVALRRLEDRQPTDRGFVLDAIEAVLPLLTLAPLGGVAAQTLLRLAA